MTARASDGAVAPNRNLLAAQVLLDELVACGVRALCLSPGSRSAPIALAAHADERLEVTVHTDERCAGFFALGLARASGRPVALSCTSGSAGANYLPAIIEAFHSRIPLVVLTADRPPELLDTGAPQTMNQHGLFGDFVRFSQAIAAPRAEARWLRWLRTRVDRAVEAATGPDAGPVHLDLHFDEPLTAAFVPGDVPADLTDDDPVGVSGRSDGAPFSRWTSARPTVPRAELNRLGELLARAERPVIVAGPGAASDAEGAQEIFGLATLMGAPLLADPLSGLRAGAVAPLITGYDAFLRAPAVATALAPDVVLHLGRTPTSKYVTQWLQAHRRVERVAVDPSGAREDPGLSGTWFVRAEAAWVAAALSPRMRRCDARPDWLERWTAADAIVVQARSRASDRFAFEATLFQALMDAIPPGAPLLVASSMPIRQLDAFWTGGRQRILANRGVNGIDGLVSSALGTAAAHTAGPAWAVLGDLALLHDLGGLAAVGRLGLTNLVIVVINNGGGGIFSYLPLAQTAAAAPGGAFDPLFTTPHDTDFRAAADLFGLEYARPGTAEELAEALRPGIRCRLVEFTVDRADSVARHRGFWTGIAESVSALLDSAG